VTRAAQISGIRHETSPLPQYSKIETHHATRNLCAAARVWLSLARISKLSRRRKANGNENPSAATRAPAPRSSRRVKRGGVWWRTRITRVAYAANTRTRRGVCFSSFAHAHQRRQKRINALSFGTSARGGACAWLHAYIMAASRAALFACAAISAALAHHASRISSRSLISGISYTRRETLGCHAVRHRGGMAASSMAWLHGRHDGAA